MSVDFNASFSGSAETFGAKMTETPAPMTASMKETGGGSASNYEALRNKPKINGHELIGDMTPAQLGITDDRHHTHKQAQAAKVWTVAHNLGKRPAVTVVDSAGTVVIGEVDPRPRSSRTTAALSPPATSPRAQQRPRLRRR